MASFLAKRGSHEAALRRLARGYPSEYEIVMKLRQAHQILYKLNPDVFDYLVAKTLRSLVKDGSCKEPQF